MTKMWMPYTFLCPTGCTWRAIKAAEAGKHILCEKPLAMNEEQVKKMFAAAKSNHVLLEEACVPPCAAGPACNQGDHRQRLRSWPPDPLSESKHSTSILNREGIRHQKRGWCGAVYDVTCYNVSLASYLFGKIPPEIHACPAALMRRLAWTWPDAVLLRYENSGVASRCRVDAYLRDASPSSEIAAALM